MSKRALSVIPCLFLLIGCQSRTPPGPLAPTPPQPNPPIPLTALKADWDSLKAPEWPATRSLAILSRTAYDELPAVTAEAAKLGLPKVIPVVVNSMAAYVCSGDGVTVVAFRGTDDRSDWGVNLDFIARVNTSHGKVHEGFRNAFTSMKPAILLRIRETKPQQLWVTGHSLGGALAAVCAMDLLEEKDLALHGVMTFGQPMIVDKELATYLDGKLRGRFVHFANQGDYIPRLPPVLSYRHFGRLVFFTPAGIDPNRVKGRADAATDDDILPMTPEEYERLRGKVEAEKRAVQAGPVTIEQRYGGQIPALRNHSMNLYLERVEMFVKPATGQAGP
jgi:triacylglycerol lipase